SSAPAAASSEPGRIDLVGRTGGDLVTASLVDGRWNAWALVPTAGRITSAPGLLSRSHGTLDAFVVRKADGAVLRLPYVNGAWRPAQLVNGLDATGRPEPVLVGHQLYAFTPATDGSLAQAVAPATGDGTWSVATVASAASSAAAATAASSGGTVELYIRTASGRLARSTASPA
ncbi:MAG: hypothetical protein QOI83_1380, partial [Streptomycetaceae bacterium]|nr:hypothetical protein [Streptomycetaceae bacterium]